MGKHGKKKSEWVLVHVDDLPVPSREGLEAARCCWENKAVWFYVDACQWHRGFVYEITERGDVKIAVRRGDTWVHGRVIRLEYVPRVLRLANSGK